MIITCSEGVGIEAFEPCAFSSCNRKTFGSSCLIIPSELPSPEWASLFSSEVDAPWPPDQDGVSRSPDLTVPPQELKFVPLSNQAPWVVPLGHLELIPGHLELIPRMLGHSFPLVSRQVDVLGPGKSSPFH